MVNANFASALQAKFNVLGIARQIPLNGQRCDPSLTRLAPAEAEKMFSYVFVGRSF